MRLPSSLSTIRWKNERPKPHEAYVPTTVEHVANILTHGSCLPLVAVLVIDLVKRATNDRERKAAVIYGCALTGLFVVSTVFHIISYLWRNSRMKDVFHRGDRAMIYLFIAGSYTPWLWLKAYPAQSWAVQLEWAVWVLAMAGIIYQQVFHERYKTLETLFYLFIALAPAYAVFEMEDPRGVAELRYGGLAYMSGVLFFKADGRLPLAHAIWHLHVVAGALIHVHAVRTHLLGHTPAEA